MKFADRIWGGAVAGAIAARALLVARPAPVDTTARLAMLPLAGAPVARPVSIRWDAHQIPFVTADSDTDLAAALGVVHGHLRLGQIDLMRRRLDASVLLIKALGGGWDSTRLIALK